MKALSKLTLSLALIGLAGTEPVIAITDTVTKTNGRYIPHLQGMDNMALSFSNRSAKTPHFITMELARPTATDKGLKFHLKEVSGTISTEANNEQSAPQSTDNKQNAPQSTDDEQSAPQSTDNEQNAPQSTDDGGIKWAPPTTSGEGMSL